MEGLSPAQVGTPLRRVHSLAVHQRIEAAVGRQVMPVAPADNACVVETVAIKQRTTRGRGKADRRCQQMPVLQPNRRAKALGSGARNRSACGDGLQP